jgi:hypothetical protein
VQVKLSCGERKVPDGQLSTHRPLDRTKPGRQPLHCNWLMVDATLKLGIPQEVHFDGQLSHSCLLLLAIMLEPSQTPLLSVGTQFPPRVNWPFPHTIQSFDVNPEHVEQDGEQG